MGDLSPKWAEAWVERYVKAWNSNEPQAIGDLFTRDAEYLTEPHARPWIGRDDIVRQWLDRRDEPGDTTFDFHVLVATDGLAIIRGRARYKSTGVVYENLWEVYSEDGTTCNRFVEWWMENKSTDNGS